MNGSRRRTLTVLLGFVLLGGALGLLLRPHEPRYAARTVSGWIEDISEHPEDWSEFQDAIHVIGPDTALPLILARVRGDDSFSRRFYRWIRPGLPLWLKHAVPECPRLRAHTYEAAGYALRRVSSGLLPKLVSALRDRERGVRVVAVAALSHLKEKPAVAVQPLIQLLNEDDPVIRLHAVKALGQMGPAARAAVPALSQLVDQLTLLEKKGTPEPATMNLLDAGHAALEQVESGRAAEVDGQ